MIVFEGAYHLEVLKVLIYRAGNLRADRVEWGSGGAARTAQSRDKSVLRQSGALASTKIMIAFNIEIPPTGLNRCKVIKHCRDPMNTDSFKTIQSHVASEGPTAQEELTIQSRGTILGGKTYTRHSRESGGRSLRWTLYL